MAFDLIPRSFWNTANRLPSIFDEDDWSSYRYLLGWYLIAFFKFFDRRNAEFSQYGRPLGRFFDGKFQ